MTKNGFFAVMVISIINIKQMWSRLAVAASRYGRPAIKSDIALIGVGTFAGTLGSLVGLGGAFIMIPILTGPLGMSAHNAIGTSMAAVLATSAGSISAYATHEIKINESNAEKAINSTILNTGIPQKYGAIDIAAVLCIVSTAAICAPLGARISKRVSDLYIRKAQSVLMMCAGASLFVRDWVIDKFKVIEAVDTLLSSDNISSDKGPNQLEPDRLLTTSEMVSLGCIGVASGFCAGFFGVGGGAIVVPTLAIVMNFEQKVALGTSMAVMFPTSLSGAIVHFFQGTMLLRQAIPLSAGCVIGSILGGNVSAYVDDTYLKSLFSGTVFGLGMRAFFKAM